MTDSATTLQYYYGKTDAQIDRRYQSEGFIKGGAVQFEGNGSVAMDDLPPILRTLLVTDGTVTKLLEAYFWEPIDVVTQKLEMVALAQRLPWLNATAGEQVLLREVHLRGAHSERVYATAFSVVRLGEFDGERVEALCRGQIGLGVLIRDSGMESYRELLELTALAEGPARPAADISALQMQRSYRIIVKGAPAILISECFPCGAYGRCEASSAPNR